MATQGAQGTGGTCSGETLTQFGRALQTLDIEGIHARTPQAKGRVERANQTLQDRLVKELRLAGICSMEQANAFAEVFRLDFNRRFARSPLNPADAHRPVLHSAQEIGFILCRQSSRTLSKNLSIQYRNTLYQVQAKGRERSLQHAEITVCETFDGVITLLHKGKPLAYTTFHQGEPLPPPEDEKTLNQRVEKSLVAQAKRASYKPRPDHPWRTPFQKPGPLPAQPAAKGTSLSGTKGDISTLG